jgi:hypothetical protein
VLDHLSYFEVDGYQEDCKKEYYVHTTNVSKIHRDCCYFNSFITWVIYVTNMHAYNSHEIHFRMMWTLLL